MDEATSAPATADAKKNPFLEAVQAFCRRIFGTLPAISPQMQAAENAMMVKARNAHRFAPRHPPHPLSHAAAVHLPATLFVTANPRFPGNLCVIRRGMDAKTFKAALRTTKRDKERGYLKPSMAALAAAGDAWSEATARREGVRVAPITASWAR